MTHESTMLERVALAIGDFVDFDGDPMSYTWTVNELTAAARVALEAMREPSAAMHTAGNIADINDYDYREVWIEMIGAALSEGGGE